MDYRAQGIQQLIRCQLLDRVTRAEVAQLAGLRSLRIEHNVNNQVRGGGTLEVALREAVDWKQVIVRLWVVLRHRGEVETHPMLTGLPALSGSTRAGRMSVATLVIKDLTVLLDDVLGRYWVVTAGTVVTTAVRDILTGLGIAELTITESSAVLRSDLTCGPGDTYRRLINDLLEAINYAAIWTTTRGVFVAQPDVAPAARPELFPLEPGPRAIRADQVGAELDTDVPNHFVLTTRGDGDQTSLVAEGWNDDPDNPYSTANQRAIPYTAEVEATDQAALNSQLDRIVAEYRWSPRKFSVQWRWFPIGPDRQIEVKDAGRLVAAGVTVRDVVVDEPIDTAVTVESMGWSWQAGEPLSQVDGVLKEVRG